MDQLRAIELLLAQDRPDAVELLIHTFLTTGDPVLRVLLEDAMVNSTLDLAPRLVEAYRSSTDPQVLAQLTRMLSAFAARQPGLDEEVVKLFVDALADPGLRTEHALALDAALVAFGGRALPALAAYLSDPASDPRGVGTAASVLSKLDASLGGNVREVVRTGFDAMRAILDEPKSTAEEQDTARQRTGSIAWAVGERPAAEHDLLAQDLVEQMLRASDAPQASTFAWGLSNLKGLSDDARLATIQSILAAMPQQANGDRRQSWLWGVNQLVTAGYGTRPLDAKFTAIMEAIEAAVNGNKGDAAIAKQLQGLIDQLQEFEQKRR
jgi:hypothetical protein